METSTFVIASAQRIWPFLSHPSSCLVLQFCRERALPDRWPRMSRAHAPDILSVWPDSNDHAANARHDVGVAETKVHVVTSAYDQGRTCPPWCLYSYLALSRGSKAAVLRYFCHDHA